MDIFFNVFLCFYMDSVPHFFFRAWESALLVKETLKNSCLRWVMLALWSSPCYVLLLSVAASQTAPVCCSGVMAHLPLNSWEAEANSLFQAACSSDLCAVCSNESQAGSNGWLGYERGRWLNPAIAWHKWAQVVTAARDSPPAFLPEATSAKRQWTVLVEITCWKAIFLSLGECSGRAFEGFLEPSCDLNLFLFGSI